MRGAFFQRVGGGRLQRGRMKWFEPLSIYRYTYIKRESGVIEAKTWGPGVVVVCGVVGCEEGAAGMQSGCWRNVREVTKGSKVSSRRRGREVVERGSWLLFVCSYMYTHIRQLVYASLFVDAYIYICIDRVWVCRGVGGCEESRKVVRDYCRT